MAKKRSDFEWQVLGDLEDADAMRDEAAGHVCECDSQPDEEEQASGRCKCCGKALV